MDGAPPPPPSTSSGSRAAGGNGSSGAWAGGGTGRWASRRLRLLDMPPVPHALRLRLACALVVDAHHGWPAAHRLDSAALSAFELYHSRPAQALRYLNVAAYMAVALGETPGWCLDERANLREVCANPHGLHKYWTVGFTPLAPSVTAILESCCILLFALQLALKAFFIGPRRFLRSVPNVLQTTLLLLTAIELVLWSSGVRHRTTISRPLRALFIVFAHRKLRDTGTAVVMMLPRVLELLFLITFLLAFSALVGFVLFAPWDPPVTAYATYGRSFYSTFLLLTETNFPDVALQPFRSSRATMLYFVSFQVNGHWLRKLCGLACGTVWIAPPTGCAQPRRVSLTPHTRVHAQFRTDPSLHLSMQLVLVFVGLALMLALLYRSYEAHMRSEALVLTRNRKRALAAAFAQLVHGWEDAGVAGALSSELMPLSRFAPLLSRMRPDLTSWQVRAQPSGMCARCASAYGCGVSCARTLNAAVSWQVNLCFEALDTRKRGVIDVSEFESVLCALHVKFESPPPVRAVRAHRLRLRARSLLKDWRITVLLDGLVLVNAAVIGWEGHLAAPPVNHSAPMPRDHGSGPYDGDLVPSSGFNDDLQLSKATPGGASHASGISCAAQVGAQMPFILLWLGETAVKLWAYKFVLLGWNFFDAILSLSGETTFEHLASTRHVDASAPCSGSLRGRGCGLLR
eukprot:scaffold2768_cov32-Tisochrysis_lutea.AAC.4